MLLHVGTAACFAGCGVLLVAAQRCGRRAVALVLAEAPRLYVSEVEAVPVRAGTGGLEVLGSHQLVEPCREFETGEADAVEFLYCPDEFRVTAHAVQVDGSRRCWHCTPTAQGEA
ncbi:hypothetical protein ACWDBO_37415 [Streptomyces mirabilis]|uniref:hypothetical protein n=1 Tax=Streptomyces mirabilis TaxID=68239 RepID=UPI00332AF0A2